MTAFTGVILAGGQGSRMGGQDKGLLIMRGEPLYQHVLQRLRPQVDIVLISANRNIDHYQLSGCQVVTDSIKDYPGPLAGMLSGLRNSPTEWVVFCACDTPNIPGDLVARLWQQRNNALVVWVKSSQRDHPTLALMNKALADDLEAWLMRGERRLMQFMREHGGHSVSFSDPESAFSNINTPDDLVEQEKS
ncbi:molybdenum cofactor guanylyltransferase MobA [Pantoea allii]|uniref:molybdenum cofactor guanylyltransferase MobA n=1 Tax=Pantoea allii TaxID=574096 RepID=UPI000A2295E9|nr:molybdenum cofactor guanylyltransferase MobA [Pantoea allii]MBW1254777.1 molybdenum cofactor guanylyltransferase MobA [Pantoea allii]MBW1264010.1 molybdenum cofactor guanylyltransferase MobA [Pantoea allii]MBW1285967.1 molybdenum cofactor guanylyltransferase MobA [Pantoea allii]ORM83410.1 molybdenum cofactor guanylyltransferase MobA [Pantoea allii]PBK01145.1 molybdenum cofactor guanylyltransferase MobA [Pantoea allii]